MNKHRIKYIMPHAPVEGAGTTPRRRRSKLMFQEERQGEAAEDTELSDAEYQRRQADKRGIKS